MYISSTVSGFMGNDCSLLVLNLKAPDQRLEAACTACNLDGFLCWQHWQLPAQQACTPLQISSVFQISKFYCPNRATFDCEEGTAECTLQFLLFHSILSSSSHQLQLGRANAAMAGRRRLRRTLEPPGCGSLPWLALADDMATWRGTARPPRRLTLSTRTSSLLHVPPLPIVRQHLLS